MTLAYDNHLLWAIGTAADPSTNFTPTATSSAILLLVVQNTNQDQLAGATVGGNAMTALTGSPALAATSEANTIYAYLITGTFTGGVAVSVAVDTTAITNKQAMIISVTAAGGQSVAVEDTSIFSTSSCALNPTVDLTTTAALNTFVAYAVHSGVAAPTSITPGADFTDLGEADFGQQSCGFRRRTSNATGGTVTCTETTAAGEDIAFFAVALKEVAGGGATVNGTAAADFTLSGAVAAAPEKLGVAAGDLSFSSAAAGAAEKVGAADASLSFSGAASALAEKLGIAAADIAFVGAVTGTVIPAWGIPQNLQATAISSSQINLTWNAITTATGYDIERGGVVIVSDHPTNSYSDTGLSPSTEYSYRVRAVG